MISKETHTKTKLQCGGALVLFYREGEDYQAFYDDAATIASVDDDFLSSIETVGLGDGQTIVVAYVALAMLETLLRLLLAKGQRVAIVDKPY